MPKLIIHSDTRIIRSMTTDYRVLPDGYEYIEVADGYRLLGENKKLDVDDVTQLDASVDEIKILQDSIDPQRIKIRQLRVAAIECWNDDSLPVHLKQFIRLSAEILRDVD